MKRIMACFLTAILLASAVLLVGCGGEEKATGSISVAINAPDIATSEGTAESNRWTEYIAEGTGLDIEWIAIPQSDMQTKMNTLLAAGEAPDMFGVYSHAYVQGLAFEGMLMPLDDVIKEHSNEYKAYIEKNPELETWTKVNGETVAFTNKRSINYALNFGMWIRQDWLDKLGLEHPTTDEEFFEVAKAFKTLGEDVVPLAYPYQFMPTIYNAHQSFWYEKEDGSGLEFAPTTDRYGDSIAMLKRMYDEGILDKEYFIDSSQTRQYELWNTGRAGILFGPWGESNNATLMKNDPEANVVPLAPFATKYGRNGMFKENPPQLFNLVNKDSENPEACVKLIDWLISDGWRDLMFGEEGKHYEMQGEVPVTICDNDTKTTEVSYAIKYMLVNDFDLKPEWVTEMAAKDEFSQKLAQQRAAQMETLMSVPFRRDIPVNNPPIDRVAQIVTDFNAAINGVTVKAITGGDEYSIEWCMDELRGEWERAGGLEAEELSNEWYFENIDSIKEFQNGQK